MEESDIRTPLYYVLGRDATAKTVKDAHQILSITPCPAGVVCRHTDKALVQLFVWDVYQANDETACNEIAAHVARATHSSTVTVGAGTEFTAVYPDGEVECLSNQTSTS
jgi:hypothetical protein